MHNIAIPSQPAMRSTRIAAGFTLVELMITVAVISVLAAVAYPNYTDYLRRSKRATAQAALLDLAGKQQAYLLDRRSYSDTTAKLGFVIPQEVANDYQFTITFDATKPLEYTLNAVPSSAFQIAKGEQTMTLTHAGTKAPAKYWTR